MKVINTREKQKNNGSYIECVLLKEKKDHRTITLVLVTQNYKLVKVIKPSNQNYMSFSFPPPDLQISKSIFFVTSGLLKDFDRKLFLHQHNRNAHC